MESKREEVKVEMSMKSYFIIGCRKCLIDALVDGDSFIDEGILAFTTDTAYTRKEVDELFKENYTCPFCGNELVFTAKLMEFVSNFMNKKYHIRFQEPVIQIITEEHEVTIPKYKHETIDLKSLIKGKDDFLSLDEMKQIINASKEVDTSKWNITIESGYVDRQIPYLRLV